jgi:hypothetical protein
VIKATQFIAFNPTGRELRSAMRASVIEEKNLPAAATVKREGFTHNSQRCRSFRKKVY